MDTKIYYFSGTGNSLAISKSISEKLQDCELIPIAKVWEDNEIKINSDRVGFIFPLYWWGLPKIVYEFIKKVHLENVNYIFAVVTRGGPIRGCVAHQLKRLMKNKDRKMNAVFFVTMVANYIVEYNVVNEEKQNKRLKRAEFKLKKIIDYINNQKNYKKIEKALLLALILNKRFRKKVSDNDKNFYSNESCNSCGICQKVCPVNNIKLIDGRPQWQHKCQKCLACIHFCPQISIQYGTRTQNKKRYHHPDVKLQEIINQK